MLAQKRLSAKQERQGKILEKVLYTDFVTTESLVEVLLEKKEIKKMTKKGIFKLGEYYD